VHHPLLVTENLTFERHLLQSATPGSREHPARGCELAGT
jgi:hypothetical protein